MIGISTGWFASPIRSVHGTLLSMQVSPELHVLPTANYDVHIVQAVSEGNDFSYLPQVEGWLTLERHFTDHSQQTNADLTMHDEESVNHILTPTYHTHINTILHTNNHTHLD